MPPPISASVRTAPIFFPSSTQAKPAEERPWWQILRSIFRSGGPRPTAHVELSSVKIDTPLEPDVAVLNARATLAFGLAKDIVDGCGLNDVSARARALNRARAGWSTLLVNLRSANDRTRVSELDDLRARLRELLFESGHLLSDADCAAMAQACSTIDGPDGALAKACNEWIAIRADLQKSLTAETPREIGRHFHNAVLRVAEQNKRLLPGAPCHGDDATALLHRAIDTSVAMARASGKPEQIRRRFNQAGVRAGWQVLGRLGSQGLPEAMQWAPTAAQDGLRNTAKLWSAGAEQIYLRLGLKPLGNQPTTLPRCSDQRMAQQLLKDGFGVVVGSTQHWPIQALDRVAFHIEAGPLPQRAEITHCNLEAGVGPQMQNKFVAVQEEREAVEVLCNELGGGKVVVDASYLQDLLRVNRLTVGDVVMDRLDTVASDGANNADPADMLPPAAESKPRQLCLDTGAIPPTWRGPLLNQLKALQELCHPGSEAGSTVTASALMSQSLSNAANSVTPKEMHSEWLGVSGLPIAQGEGTLCYDAQPGPNNSVVFRSLSEKNVTRVMRGPGVEVDANLSKEVTYAHATMDGAGNVHFPSGPTYGLLLVQQLAEPQAPQGARGG